MTPAGAGTTPPAGPLPLSARLRIALRIHLILATLALCVPAHLLWRIFAHHSPWPRLFLRAMARIVGARVRIAGTPLHRDVFYVANHVSWIDIPALAGASGTAFVAKAEVADAPVLGWLCRLNRTIFVRREARLDVAGQINALRDALEDNHAIAIFPEGTTSNGRALLPFKSAMLQVLDPPPPGIMVQPVLLDYGPEAETLAWVGDEPGLANVARILGRRGSFLLRVTFLEPFSPDQYRGRKVIAAEARRRIEQALFAPHRDHATNNATDGTVSDSLHDHA